MLSLYSANSASPNWPLLPDCYCQKTDVLRSFAVLYSEQEVAEAKCRLAWPLKDRSKPKPNNPVLSLITRRNAGSLFNKIRLDSGALSL